MIIIHCGVVFFINPTLNSEYMNYKDIIIDTLIIRLSTYVRYSQEFLVARNRFPVRGISLARECYLLRGLSTRDRFAPLSEDLLVPESREHEGRVPEEEEKWSLVGIEVLWRASHVAPAMLCRTPSNSPMHWVFHCATWIISTKENAIN